VLKLVVAANDAALAEELRERLQGFDVVLVRRGDRAALRRELASADAVLTNRLDADDTREATRLRLAQAFSAGADGLDRAALPPGCALCNVHGHEEAVAQWALMAMLALTRHLLAYDRDLRRGLWHRWPPDALPAERTLEGRVLGSVGYGPIGRRTAELARAAGMQTVAVTRRPAPDRARGLGWLGGLDQIDRLMREADIALVALPLTPETRGIVDARRLELLGRDGYLLNVARGDLVQEEELYRALRDGVTAGAAIDVWYAYPSGPGENAAPSRFPFHELENVVMTPHVSGRSEETWRRRHDFFVEQLERLGDGRELRNVLAVG
jgi:phosphoglycerate dehydrogenase-like enzyme